MMNRKPQLSINPNVLRWAREESGYSVPELAKKLDIGEQQYLEWESTGTNIPFSILRRLATTFRRQIAVFFLPIPPDKITKPTDYRNLGVVGAKLSVKILLAMRRSNKFRDFLLEQNGDEYYKTKYKWLSEFEVKYKHYPLSQKDTTVWIRQLLKYSLDDQITDKTANDAYVRWRNSFENELGIYTFQLSMPSSESQGFCYSDAHPYCIVVNGRYSVASRIFTLFHELGHILQRQSGLCMPDNVSDDEAAEFECNLFAGRVLLPDDVMVRTLDKEEIYKRARKFKVSSEVYLRRLKSLGRISDAEFFPLLTDIRSSIKQPRGFAILSPLQKGLASRGEALFNLVLDALHKDRISYERASDILEVKIDHLVNA